MVLKFKLEKGVECPSFQTDGSVGMDISVNKIINLYKGSLEAEEEKLIKVQKGFLDRKFIKIRGFERVLFGTGIFVEIPSDIELQLRIRSSVALKKGLQILNAPGTIDSDYRGELKVLIYNSTPFLTNINYNERIAQIIPKEVIRPKTEIVEILEKTHRNEGGFGSTNEN